MERYLQSLAYKLILPKIVAVALVQSDRPYCVLPTVEGR